MKYRCKECGGETIYREYSVTHVEEPKGKDGEWIVVDKTVNDDERYFCWDCYNNSYEESEFQCEEGENNE